ncbi:MAG: hypothetical protein ACYCUF_07145 [Acidimicrobiales bacterium]
MRERRISARPIRARRVRTQRSAAGAAALVLAVAVLTSGCANANGLALARKACSEVQRSISLYDASTLGHDPALEAKQRAEALRELRLAVQPAAIAAGEAPQWSALGATLSESNRVPEGNLLHALRAQCRVAESSNPLLGPPPSAPATSTPPTLPPPQGR